MHSGLFRSRAHAACRCVRCQRMHEQGFCRIAGDEPSCPAWSGDSHTHAHTLCALHCKWLHGGCCKLDWIASVTHWLPSSSLVVAQHATMAHPQDACKQAKLTMAPAACWLSCSDGVWASRADPPSASCAPAPRPQMSLNLGLCTELERRAFKDRTGRRATVEPAMPAARPLAQRMSQTCTLPSLDPAASLQRSATSCVSCTMQVSISDSACTSLHA